MPDQTAAHAEVGYTADMDVTLQAESDAIQRLLADADPANGDDAAPIRVPGGTACISTDSTVAGVHAPIQMPARLLGRRAAARAISDMAAMGAVPAVVTCAALVPEGRWDDAVDAVQGVRARAGEQGAALVGGDLASSGGGPLTLVVTVVGHRTGSAPAFCTRRGMRAGDELWVTGQLGAATHALAVGAVSLPEPPDRIRAGIALAPHVSAMLDVSDGIARDAQNLATASRCGLDVPLDALPLAEGVDNCIATALGGDDYELLLALSPAASVAARAALARADHEVGLTQIGVATDEPGVVRFTLDGTDVSLPDGFTHR